MEYGLLNDLCYTKIKQVSKFYKITLSYLIHNMLKQKYKLTERFENGNMK